MDSAPPPKKRCISQERRRYLKQKAERRGWGSGSACRETDYRVRMTDLAVKQQAVAAAQQHVAADKQRLIDERTQLMQTSRNKFREADAAKEKAQRETAWANKLIFSELAGSKLSRALALEARLLDTGYVSQPAARRAAAAKEAQDQVDASRC